MKLPLRFNSIFTCDHHKKYQTKITVGDIYNKKNIIIIYIKHNQRHPQQGIIIIK